MDTGVVEAFRRRMRGAVMTPADPGYDGARRVWNGMVDRRPWLIARPETTAEVADAVTFAQDHALPLTVKGGGHGLAGWAVCDDGLVIDLSRMDNVRVDPDVRMATVQGGATLRAL